MFGIFNDEGLVEGDFHTAEEASRALRGRYELDDDLEIAECCHDHPASPREGCDQCAEAEVSP